MRVNVDLVQATQDDAAGAADDDEADDDDEANECAVTASRGRVCRCSTQKYMDPVTGICAWLGYAALEPEEVD